MEFDIHGNLKPYGSIEANLQEFEEVFVTGFPASSGRQDIWLHFNVFLEEFKNDIMQEGFYMWLNGSFVTRKANPRDLDLVIFLDFGVMERAENKLSRFKSLAYQKEKSLDIYFSSVYPTGHRYNIRSVLDAMEWLDLFSHSRPQKHTRKRPKGFIKIAF